MTVRPPFIYALIFALSLLSIQYLLGAYQAYSLDETQLVDLELQNQYQEDEVLDLILSLAKENEIELENYSKTDRLFRVSGQSLLVKQFLENLEKEKKGVIKMASIEKFDGKVVMSCNF